MPRKKCLGYHVVNWGELVKLAYLCFLMGTWYFVFSPMHPFVLLVLGIHPIIIS